MTARPDRRARIQEAADRIADLRRTGTAPAAIVEALVADHGAVHRTSGSTNSLRIAGVQATCTWSKDFDLLAAWTRNATIALMKLDGRVA